MRPAAATGRPAQPRRQHAREGRSNRVAPSMLASIPSQQVESNAPRFGNRPRFQLSPSRSRRRDQDDAVWRRPPARGIRVPGASVVSATAKPRRIPAPDWCLAPRGDGRRVTYGVAIERGRGCEKSEAGLITAGTITIVTIVAFVIA